MTDATASADAVEEVTSAKLDFGALDGQLTTWLVDRAKADEIRRSGEGGLQSPHGVSVAVVVRLCEPQSEVSSHCWTHIHSSVIWWR
ncbi:hypothetical protein ACWERW_31560 [Streptomyces sp. NPDC004012]